MTRDELWSVFTSKNPRMAGGDDSHITLTVRGLRKLFEQAYDRGHEQGVANGRAMVAREAEINASKDKPSERGDLFSEMFGKNNPFKP